MKLCLFLFCCPNKSASVIVDTGEEGGGGDLVSVIVRDHNSRYERKIIVLSLNV